MPSKVYYNSACPVCDAGIKDQRRRMEGCGLKDIEWVDVHAHPEMVSELGASLEEVRERHLWSQTHGQRWLATALQLPVLKQAMRLMYNLFARLLYRWNLAKKNW
ncbi:MAG: hypothetical protein RL610_1479 [Pseudomonadota bacterium]